MEPSRKKRAAPDDFYEQLTAVGGPDLAAFARWVVDNAPAHGLSVAWGSAGPLLQFAHPKHAYLSFVFGQIDHRGVLAQRQCALLRRCEELHVGVDVVRDYMQAVAALIPGACVKTFALPGGGVKELIVAGENARPTDWPSLAPLALRKEEWFAAIDRTIERIRAVLDRRPEHR